MHLRETTDLSQRSQELGTITCSKILQSKQSLPSDLKETRSNRESRKDQCEVSNITTKGDMEGQQNPNEPGKSGIPDNKVGSSKIARNRNVNANSVSAKNKVANRAVAAVNRVVAANRVVSKADDKPGYLEQKAAGENSRRFVYLCTTRFTHYRFYGVC